MNRKNRAVSTAFTGAAAALVMSTTVPAHAVSETWDIKNNNASYQGAIKAKNPVSLVFISSHGFSLICLPGHYVMSARAPDSIVAGMPATLIDISHLTGTSCSFGGVRFDFSAGNNATLAASSYKSGVTKGKIKGLQIKMAGVGNSCNALFSGSLPVSYINRSNNLKVDPASAMTMKVVSAHRCAGLTNGAQIAVTTTFHVTSPSALTVSGS